ncbi:MAG: hypothetical protein LC634_05895 [Sphingomonadales bacterium]|nr:hypothetical protein [Sphingomonadales bacterium]
MRKILTIGAALGVSACAATAPQGLPATSPTLMTTTGLEAVLGATAAGLTQMFGEPAQDFREPGARKLQFTDGSCVLDAYLYPEGGGGASGVISMNYFVCPKCGTSMYKHSWYYASWPRKACVDCGFDLTAPD